jgi:hypothetical protein
MKLLKNQEDAVPDFRPLDANQKMVAIGFPSLGAVMLAVGLYLIVIKDSQSPFVFGALGIIMILFLIASASIGYQLFGPARSVNRPASPKTPHAEAKATIYGSCFHDQSAERDERN